MTHYHPEATDRAPVPASPPPASSGSAAARRLALLVIIGLLALLFIAVFG